MMYQSDGPAGLVIIEPGDGMPYVRKDDSGRITAVSMEALEGFEQVPSDAAELAEFEQQLIDTRARLEESDLDVIRVLDDLITVLVDKNLIRFTDLPAAAQRKLLARRRLREAGSNLHLLDDQTDVI